MPAEHQIVGLGPVTMSVPDTEYTELVVTRILNMARVRVCATPGNEVTWT